MPLSEKFTSLFADSRARRELSRLAGVSHTKLPTFNLTTTSLRHIPKWFDHLEAISRGASRSHGNFFTDPASIGLVDNSVRPRRITPAGQAFLLLKPTLYRNVQRAEYQLIKILYFSGYTHSTKATDFLERKRSQMLSVLEEFVPLPSREIFVSKPKLLVIAELIASFPGAIRKLVQLPPNDLAGLASLGEKEFKKLCLGPGFPTGLDRLCNKIANEFARAEERRLYYIISMCLLTIASRIPPNTVVPLQVPHPYSNFLTETDIYRFHAQYTQDITLWFQNDVFLISSSLAPLSPQAPPPAAVTVQNITFIPRSGLPGGIGQAAATHVSRRQGRAATGGKVTVDLDPVASKHAEDFVQSRLLQPEYGSQLRRAGHTASEIIALPDGIVPGADFFVVNSSDEPVAFIEVKSISGSPPTEITLTNAEYIRACRCATIGIPYRLLLVDVGSGQFYEVTGLPSIATATLEKVIRFVIKVG